MSNIELNKARKRRMSEIAEDAVKVYRKDAPDAHKARWLDEMVAAVKEQMEPKVKA